MLGRIRPSHLRSAPACLPISNSLTPQRRRGSKDAAGDEKSEWERRLDKPSVPLKAIGEPGPPRIVEIQEKYGAVEGEIENNWNFRWKIFYLSDQTACCYMFVEGNPAPTFKFYKVNYYTNYADYKHEHINKEHI